MSTGKDWPMPADFRAAWDHLQEVRQQYVAIGAAGVLGLTLSLNPLVVRYEKGERTTELLEAMRNVE